MAERKHLFHSTEKSDFILNMTEPQFQKMGLIYLSLTAIVLFAMNIPYYLSKGKLIFAYSQLNMLQTVKFVDMSFVNTKCADYIAYLQIALYAASFIGLLLLIIAATKKYFRAKDNKLFMLPVLYMLFVLISTFMAYDISSAFFGKDHRYAGMLTFFSYVALFVAASQVNSRSRRKTYLDLFLSIAFINAVYGIMQTVPALVTELPNFFYDIFYISGNTADSYERFIADGLVQSPHALAALMTMATAIAAAGLVYEKSKIRKCIYAVCCAVFAAAGFATCAAPAFIGIPFVVIAVLVTEIIRSAFFGKKSSIAKTSWLWSLVSIAAVAAVFGIMLLIDRIHLYDANIIWTDATSRLGNAFPEPSNYSGLKIYPKLWKECLAMLKDTWVLGSGPDCIGFKYYGTTELFNSSFGFTTDRSYNEYFDIALACGIPCLLVYLSMGFVTIKKGCACVKKFFMGEDSWTAVALLAAVLGYGLQANINISVITVTPFFFIFVGMLWNKPHTETETSAPKKKERKIRK